MTLEDQIRRMGDARASAVTAPPWHDRVGGRRGRAGRWAVAAVAVAAIAVGGTIALTGDDNEGETLAGEPDHAEIRRWVPNSDIAFVEYGTLGEEQFNSSTEVALVTTPTDAGSPDDADWTQVVRGTFPSLGFDSAAELRAFTFEDEFAILWVPNIDDPARSTLVISRRFDEASLLAEAPSLEGRVDLAAAAATVADWSDDIEVIYAGPAAVPDVTIWPTKIRWLDSASDLQSAATYPPVDVDKSFVLGSRDEELLTDPFVWTNDPDMREVDDDEWREIHSQLAQEITEVTVQLHMSFPSQEDREAGHEDFPAVSAQVVNRGATRTIKLLLDEPVEFQLSDSLQIWMFPFILDFRVPSSHVGETAELVMESRLSDWEAERLAELINQRLGEASPAPYPTTAPTEPVACGQPSAADLDRATHLSAGRTPLDIDQDGVDDELFILEAEEGTSVVFARLASGWTGRARISSDGVALLQRPAGGAAARDLDSDGWAEFFVSVSTGVDVVSLPRCEVVDPVNAHFVNIEGEWCIPGGCDWRFKCVSDVLLREVTVPGGDFDDHDASDVRWTRQEFRLVKGDLVGTPLPHVDYDPADPPIDAPNSDSTGVVDCSPDGDGDSVQIARPECMGNTAPTEESDPRVVVVPSDSLFDVDADGHQDELISFVGDDGGVWLVLDLGDDNYTNAIPAWFNGSTDGFRPGLVLTPEGEIAMADITGNGSREFFLGVFGNTGRSASPAGIDGCALRWFAEGNDGQTGEFFVTIGVGGNSCAPTGCTPRLSCVDGELVYEITGPADAFDPEQPADQVEVRWATTVYRFADGAFVVDRESETTFLAAERPADAPALSDVIDCTP